MIFLKFFPHRFNILKVFIKFQNKCLIYNCISICDLIFFISFNNNISLVGFSNYLYKTRNFGLFQFNKLYFFSWEKHKSAEK